MYLICPLPHKLPNFVSFDQQVIYFQNALLLLLTKRLNLRQTYFAPQILKLLGFACKFIYLNYTPMLWTLRLIRRLFLTYLIASYTSHPQCTPSIDLNFSFFGLSIFLLSIDQLLYFSIVEHIALRQPCSLLLLFITRITGLHLNCFIFQL
jgi:hypothetical protein